MVVLGSGPNRIGQGIEFDYACVHASYALKEAGYDAVMVNSNPETVSTDYDTSTRLYFEPLTAEHVLEVIRREKPEGVILQFGGQSPLKLARELEKNGAKILGTTPDAIDLAEDRSRFGRLLTELAIPHPRFGTARSADEAREVARELGYPVVVRPSYVLGGRRMEIVYNNEDLDLYLTSSADAEPGTSDPHRQVHGGLRRGRRRCGLDGEEVYVGGIMEHVEEAGVHSGDSSCVMPPITHPPGARRADRGVHQASGPGRRGRRADERAVHRARRGRPGHRVQPARLAHGAVHLQGDRRAAGEGGDARVARGEAAGDGARW